MSDTKNWLYVEGSIDDGFTLYGLFTEHYAQCLADCFDASSDANAFFTTVQLRSPTEETVESGHYAVVAGNFHQGWVFYGPFATEAEAADSCGHYANQHGGEAVAVLINSAVMLPVADDEGLDQ